MFPSRGPKTLPKYVQKTLARGEQKLYSPFSSIGIKYAHITLITSRSCQPTFHLIKWPKVLLQENQNAFRKTTRNPFL